MTRESLTPPAESSRPTDDGKDLYQRGPLDLVERRPYYSTGSKRYSLSLKKTYVPIYPGMAPIQHFVEWASFWDDYADKALDLDDNITNTKRIPYYPDSVANIVQEQYDLWEKIVKRVDLMIYQIANDQTEWDWRISLEHARESLLIFLNLMLAPEGLRFEHLNGRSVTRYARLGPCAIVQEVKAVIVGSKLCAYYEFKPFDELQALLHEYKRLLRKTDANPSRKLNPKRRNKRRYDESIERQMPSLMTAVNKASTDLQELNKKLDKIPDEEGPWDKDVPDLLESITAKEYQGEVASEKAHCHFQMVHYIKARVEETDIEVPQTPMNTWQPPGGQTQGAEARRLVLPEGWQQQRHVPVVVDNIISSLQGLISEAGSQKKPQRRLSLRRRASFYDDDDPDDDVVSVISSKTVVPETKVSEATVSEATVSEAGQSESSSRPESSTSGRYRYSSHGTTHRGRDYPRPKTTLPITRPPPRPTFRPDWTVPVSDSDTESESGSESESEAGF